MQPAEPRRRTRLSPDVRNRQLMDHAIAVFAQRGLGRAGHADIAERANVSVATVFNYFRTREDLIERVLDEVEQFLDQLAHDAYTGELSPRDALRQYIDGYVDAAYEHSAYCLIALEWAASIREDLWPRYMRFAERQQDRLRQVLQRGLDNGEFRPVMNEPALLTMLHGLHYPACQMIFREPQPPRDEVKAFMRQACRLALGLQ